MIIDKSTWKPYKLGDVTVKKEENDKPNASKRFDKFIKVEHLDAESLHTKRWGNTLEDELPPTFYKIFRKGQVLYPTRNPHLKRVALASFDGICGEKTLTLEPIQDIVDERFYPFIFLAHSFFTHTTKSIIGSTNPHVRWRDVAEYEFLLPPKDHQARLAELLWAADDVLEKYEVLSELIKSLLQINVEDLIWNSEVKKSEIKNISSKEVKGFVDGDWIESKDQSESGIRLIQLADIGVGEFIDKSRRYISEETFKRLKCFELLEGDLLIARMPDPLGRCSIFPKIENKAITAVDVCIVRVDVDNHNPKYWEYAFNSKSWFELTNIYASGTTRTRISKKNLESLELPYPTKTKQDKIVQQLEIMTDVKNKTAHSIEILKQIQKQLINQIFST